MASQRRGHGAASAATVVAVVAAAASPVAAMLPPFTWATVPTYAHMCNESGPFSNAALTSLVRHSIVTIEKVRRGLIGRWHRL